MTTNGYHYFIAFFLTLFLLPAYIQASNGTDTLSLSLEEVTVQAEATPSDFSSITPKQSLTRKQIELQGFSSVSDALRRFSGISVRDYGGIGGLKTVNIRGFGASHTNVTVDGISVGNMQSGQVDIGQFSLENIDYLSVTIGTADNLLVPARELISAGTIHISSIRPPVDQKGWKLSGGTKAGSFGLINPSLMISKNFSKGWSTLLYSEYTRADGNYPFVFNTGRNLEKRKRYNSDVSIYRMGSTIYRQTSEKNSLNIKIDYYHSNRGLPGSAILGVYNNSERLRTQSLYIQANNRVSLGERWDWLANAKYTYHKDRYSDFDAKYSDSTLINRYRQTEYYASSAIRFKANKQWHWSVSSDYIHNRIYMFFRETGIADINYPPQNRANRNTLLGAVSTRFREGRWLASASILTALYLESVKVGSPPPNKRKITPSVAIRYQLSPHVFLRFSHKHFFRVPSFNDMYYTQIGNRQLKPELARQTNMGVTVTGSNICYLKDLDISIDAYYNNVKNKIVATPSMFVWRMLNRDKVRIKGVDVRLALSKEVYPSVLLSSDISYSFQDAQDRETKQQIIYTPKHAGSGTIAVQLPWISFSYSLMASSLLWTSNYHTSLNKIDAYVDHSCSIQRAWHIGNRLWRTQVGISNIGNKNYEIIKNYPMPGRSFSLSISTSW